MPIFDIFISFLMHIIVRSINKSQSKRRRSNEGSSNDNNMFTFLFWSLYIIGNSMDEVDCKQQKLSNDEL